MRSFAKIMRGVALLTQLGLSIIAPPLLLVWVALRLQARFGLRSWVIVAAILAGLVSSACSAYGLCRKALRHTKKGEDEQPPSFNKHV